MNTVTDIAPHSHGAPTAQQPPGFGKRHEHAAAAGDETESPVDVADMADMADMADLIFRLIRTSSHAKARMVSTIDAGAGTLFLLGQLVKGGPTTAKNLAAAMCTDQSTVSRQIAGLVRSGLIVRQADQVDGRASMLVPTSLGVLKANEYFAKRGRALEALLADWSDDERQQFIQLLGRFTTSLESRRG